MTGTARILIVDHAPADGARSSQALFRAGYQAACLHHAPAALTYLQQRRVDLALIDAELTGPARSIRIAYAAYRRDVPVILTSGAPDAADRLKNLFWPYPCKPFNDAVLIETVKRVLAEHYGAATLL